MPHRSQGARITRGTGGRCDHQEALDLFAAYNIVSDIKLIPIDDVNTAFKALVEGSADVRYVIDMATLKGKDQDDRFAVQVGL